MVEQNEIESLKNQIVHEYDPERVILFGSYAYGTPSDDSDVDLLIILDFKGKPFRKSVEVSSKINPPFPVDILVRNPDDVRRRYQCGDPLIREALDKGRVLHERNRDRMDSQGRS